MDLGLEFLVGVLLFEGEMLCCCDRGEKGWIITLRVGRLVTFVGGIFGVEGLSGKILVMLDWKFKCG